jgi:endoglucanase
MDPIGKVYVMQQRRTSVLGGLGAVVSLAALAVACSGTDSTSSSPDAGSLGAAGRNGGADEGTLNVDGGVTPAATSACVPAKFPETFRCEGQPGPWAEVLQKSLWFFNANRSGPDVSCKKVQWRGDSHVSDAQIRLDPSALDGVDGISAAFIEENRAVLDPDGDGMVDLSGGFHDAGDYIKFGLTSAFSASQMAWAMVDYGESFTSTGLDDEARLLLRWFGDYFLRSTFRDDSGNLVAFAHQVGDASDHTCGWMPPEVRKPAFCPRKGYFVSEETPAADVTSSAAAALAAISVVFRASDPTYADRALDAAKSLYAFAAKYPTAKAQADQGLYGSEYAWDDLAWAALWLHQATGDWNYVEDVTRGVLVGTPSEGAKGWVCGFPGFPCPCDSTWASVWLESHTHCWNSLRSGVFLKLAQTFQARQQEMGLGQDAPESKLAEVFRKITLDNVKFWMNTVPKTPSGFTIKDSWGSGRYNAAAQYIALSYARSYEQDPEVADIRSWAQRQIDYLLGDNPLQKSYVMGFSAKYANQPHHAAGHASIFGLPDNPIENRHVIWGALVNGPSDEQDGHVDQRSDYGKNEVSIDYNASLLSALAAHYQLRGQGQCPLDDFPPVEAPIDEFYSKGKVNAQGPCSAQVEITVINESIHPPRYDAHLSARYFFDVGELLAQGIDPKQMQVSVVYDRGATEFGEPTKVEGPFVCSEDASTYYVELSYEGYEFWGEMTKLKAPRTTILRIGVADGAGCVFDDSNDFSYQGLKSDASAKTPQIPVYSAGTLVWGNEPACNARQEPPSDSLPEVK